MKLKAGHFWLILLGLSFIGLIVSAIIYSATLNKGAIIALFVFTTMLFAVLFLPMCFGFFKSKKCIFFCLNILCIIFYIALLSSIIPFGIFKYIVENEKVELITLGIWMGSFLGLGTMMGIDNTIKEVIKSKEKKAKKAKKISEQKDNETDKTDNRI